VDDAPKFKRNQVVIGFFIMEERLDLYTDYLLSSTGMTAATGLSRLLDGHLSHDQITRLLSDNEFTSKDLWH
jgi:hypothetical protein